MTSVSYGRVNFAGKNYIGIKRSREHKKGVYSVFLTEECKKSVKMCCVVMVLGDSQSHVLCLRMRLGKV